MVQEAKERKLNKIRFVDVNDGFTTFGKQAFNIRPGFQSHLRH